MTSLYQEPFYILSYWRIFLSITAEYKEERYSDSKNCSSKIPPPSKKSSSFLLDYWALVVKVKINFHRYISSKMHILALTWLIITVVLDLCIITSKDIKLLCRYHVK